MKDKIVYILVFGGTFIGVTFGIMLLNTMFVNIFHFDFTPASEVVQPPKANLNTNLSQQLLDEKIDPARLDSLMKYYYQQNANNYVEVKMDSTVYDSLKSIRIKLSHLEKENKKVITPPKPVDTVKTKVDPLAEAKKLEEWAKQTAKLYESMDPKKAAKIIQNYSDNESRQIIFKMNKKQAAKILAELNPEQVQRITKAL